MAESLVARGVAKLGRLAHRYRETPVELARMAASPNAVVRDVARACEATLAPQRGSGDALPLRAIESLRSELLASREPVDPAAPDAPNGRLGPLCRAASKPPLWSRFLFQLVRTRRPERCLELGTCLGLSAAYQAAALALNGSGTLVTLEGSSARATHARAHLERLGLGDVRVVQGRFQDTLTDVLLDLGKLDHAFVDGHHDETATQEYFEAIAARATPGALVVLDDIRWSPGMRQAWERLRVHRAVAASLDLFVMGVCVLGDRRGDDAHFTVALG